MNAHAWGHTHLHTDVDIDLYQTITHAETVFDTPNLAKTKKIEKGSLSDKSARLRDQKAGLSHSNHLSKCTTGREVRLSVCTYVGLSITQGEHCYWL